MFSEREAVENAICAEDSVADAQAARFDQREYGSRGKGLR